MLRPRPSRALPCPACGSITGHEHLFDKNECAILRCEACGLGRAEARGFDPAKYYTRDYFSGGHADGYANYLAAERVLRREFAGTVEFIRRHSGGGRLLELGCAYGFFLQEARRYFDVAGIELAEDAAAHCRRNGLRVLTGLADDLHLRELGAMDVIVLLDVIEHLPEPHETLALCARHLRAGGIVVLTTGDFGSPLARIARASWRLMTPPQHLWFFTEPSIERLAARLDMRLEALDHPWKIVPAALIWFQLARMLGVKSKGAALGTRLGVPVNLFDAMRVVLRKTGAS
jgi:SAM-dependent methyltransferase